MIHTAGSHENQQDLESFLLMLSPKIKNDVTKHIFFDAFRSNDLFKENTQEIQIEKAIHGMIPYLMRPEDTVVVQGEFASFFYFIIVGECEVKVKDHKYKHKINQKLLTEGDYFGECALLYDCKRSATITTTNYCTFSRLNKDQFTELT